MTLHVWLRRCSRTLTLSSKRLVLLLDGDEPLKRGGARLRRLRCDRREVGGEVRIGLQLNLARAEVVLDCVQTSYLSITPKTLFSVEVCKFGRPLPAIPCEVIRVAVANRGTACRGKT